jgi:hypothetical protein
VAALVVALHFITTREPATVPLPTARFAPNRPVRARARALKLSDLLLLLCRVALILAVGTALAQPIPAPAHRAVVRIVMADRSGSVADAAEVSDSARAPLSSRDVLIPFDSGSAAGSLSAAMVVALRAASAHRDESDSLEIAIVSAFASEELDQATDSIRALWPGAIRLARVAAHRDTVSAPALMFVGAPDDPLRFALPSPVTDSAEVRIVRGTPERADSGWAAGGSRTLVLWPAADGPAPDTIAAVSAGDAAVVAPFPRFSRPTPLAGRVVARWLDGSPAAVETSHGNGCIRTVDIPVASLGDLVLDARFQRLASRLTARCGGARSGARMSEARMAALAGAGKSLRVPSRVVGRPDAVRSPLTPWLLAIALGLGLGELLLRRRRTRGALMEAAS